MYAWLVGRLIRRGYAEAAAGNPKMLMALAAEDVEFVFPGQNSFAGRLHGKAALEAWMARYASLHPRMHVQDVVVSGAPWHLRVAVRFDDGIGEDYSNEGVEYLQLTAGKLRKLEVFLDTERVAALESLHPEVVGVE